MAKIANKLPEVTEEEFKTFDKFNQKITKEFLEQKHLSTETLIQYRSGIFLFFKWVKDERDNKSILDLKPRDALSYQNYLISRGLSTSAIKFKRSCVSTLCGYIEVYYGEDYPLFRNIYNKKIPNPGQSFVHEKHPLTPEEYNNLIKILKEKEKWQQVAYLKFSYSTGCRRQESVQLLKEVVDYKKTEGKSYYQTHNIRCKGKGLIGEVRKLVYDEDAMEAIKFWLAIRGQDDCPYVFVHKTKDGRVEQLDKSTFNRWCSDLFTSIVGRRVHPHILRESRATNLVIGEGKDIKSAQSLLGHKNSTTTEIYVIRDTSDDIDDCF